MAKALDALLAHPGLWRGSRIAPVSTASIPTGFEHLDHELPGGGWPTGCLTEILTPGSGIGELACLMPALARLGAASRRQCWIAPPYLPYAPALAAAGIECTQLVVVTPPDPRRDTLWALEQTLRANAFGAVLAWPAAGRTPKYAELRRLQLATEACEVLAILLRPIAALEEASPAALRIALEPASHGRIALRVVKRRGAVVDHPVLIDLSRPQAVGSRQPSRFAARGVPARELVN